MKVAYVCADPGVPIFGRKGCSIHVQEVVRALLKRGATVDLIATRCEGKVPAGLESVRVHPLPPIPKGDLARREQAAIAANAALDATLRTLGPVDLVYERFSLWSHAAMERAACDGAAGVLEVNAPLIEEQAQYRGLVDRPAAERLARRAFAAAKTVVAVSREVAQYVRREALAPAERVHVIGNGVDVGRFRPDVAPVRVAEPGSFVVGFVGSMKPWHGLSGLIDAFARLHRARPQSQLVVVGEGVERSAVESRAVSMGLGDSIRLTGAAPPEDVPGLLASFDAAVAPYPATERFYFSPLKVYEYMASGRATVVSRVGDMDQLIAHDVNGLLYPPDDAIALADALARLQADPGLRRRLGAAARETVLRDHAWDAVVQRIIDLAMAASSSQQAVT